MNILGDDIGLKLGTNTLSTMAHILNMGVDSIIERCFFMNKFGDTLEETISMLNLVFCGSSNSFYPLKEVSLVDNIFSPDIDEYPFDGAEVRENICIEACDKNVFSTSFVDTIFELGENSDAYSETYANYLMYKAYMTYNMYGLVIDFVMEFDDRIIPYIKKDDNFSYIPFSLSLNSWWDNICNREVQKIKNSEGAKREFTVPWIKPIIAVSPNLDYVASDIRLVDMAPILFNEDNE